MNRYPILDPGVAARLGQQFFKGHTLWPDFQRLVQAGPIWDRQAVATTPVTLSFFGTARSTPITGNNKKAGGLGSFFKIITGIKCDMLMESAVLLNLDMTELAAGAFLKLKIEDYDWIDTIPLHHFLDGAHTTWFSDIGASSAANWRGDLGRPGDGAPFPVFIPYCPDQSITAEVVFSSAGAAGQATALVCDLSLFGPRWYRKQGRPIRSVTLTSPRRQG